MNISFFIGNYFLYSHQISHSYVQYTLLTYLNEHIIGKMRGITGRAFI